MKPVILNGEALFAASQFRYVLRDADGLTFVAARDRKCIKTVAALPVLREWMRDDITIDEAVSRVRADALPPVAPTRRDSITPDCTRVGSDWILIETTQQAIHLPAKSLLTIRAIRTSTKSAEHRSYDKAIMPTSRPATDGYIVLVFGNSAYALTPFEGCFQALATLLISDKTPVPRHITSRPSGAYWTELPRTYVHEIKSVPPGSAALRADARLIRDFSADPERKVYLAEPDATPEPDRPTLKRPSHDR